jgi:hypothetical protein
MDIHFPLNYGCEHAEFSGVSCEDTHCRDRKAVLVFKRHGEGE